MKLRASYGLTGNDKLNGDTRFMYDQEYGEKDGYNIGTSNSYFTYRKISVEKRVFTPKMYFYPIPGSVILNEQVMAAGWAQNPLW